MPASGGKAYLLLVEDVKGLAETDEYRSDKITGTGFSSYNFHPCTTIVLLFIYFLGVIRV